MSDEQFLEDDEFELVPTSASPDGEFTQIPDGTFVEAEVMTAEKKLHPFFKVKETEDPLPIVNFGFRIAEGEYENRYVWGFTPTTFTNHADCKLRQWVQAVLDETDLTTGFRFSLKDLVGCKTYIVVGLQTWEDKVTKEDRWKNVVDDVIGLSEGASLPKAQPVAVKAEEAPEEPF